MRCPRSTPAHNFADVETWFTVGLERRQITLYRLSLAKECHEIPRCYACLGAPGRAFDRRCLRSSATRRTARGDPRTSLSRMDIRRLTNLYWECQPKQPGEPCTRDAIYCGAVSKALSTRVNKVPALELFKPVEIVISEPIELLFQGQPASMRPGKIRLSTPQAAIAIPPPPPISAAAL
jgi:hypothetical protein